MTKLGALPYGECELLQIMPTFKSFFLLLNIHWLENTK